MTDFIDVPATPSTAPSDNPDRPVCAAHEIAAGKALAIISYALNFCHLPFFLVPLIMRSDRFSLYHAKQCLIVWLTAVVIGAVWGAVAFVLAIVTVGLGVCLIAPVSFLLWIGLVVINIIGLVNAVNGRCVPLPVIGGLAERWFAGIKAQPQPGTPV